MAMSEPIKSALQQAYGSKAIQIELIRPGCFCRDRSEQKTERCALTLVSSALFGHGGGYGVLLRALEDRVREAR